MTENAPKISDHLCPECRDHFTAVCEVLDLAELPYTLDPRLVRGLDYYQRTTFEIVSGDIGSQSAVAGGGRYDGLIEKLGGPKLPGIGFACGMERLALLLADREEPHLDFYLAVLDESALNTSLILAQQLRDKGFSGEVGFEAKSVKSQLRQANKKQAKTCLLLGTEEMEKGQIIVKDMATGTQQAVSQDDLEQALGLQ